MKKLLTVFFFTFSLSSYGQITFQKSFTTGVGYCVHQTIDSGYIVIGTIYPAGAGNTIDVSLIKTNQYGDTLWTRTFGLNNYDYAYTGQQTSDGGYIIAGGTENPGDYLYLIKTNNTGDTLWTKIIKDVGGGTSMLQTSDSGYVITGTVGSWVYLIKVDGSGEVLWEKSYGLSGGYDISGRCVRQTSDNGFIIVSDTYRENSGGTNIYIIKTDRSGDTLWTKNMSESGHDLATSILQTFDGNYIVSGQTSNSFLNTSYHYLMKLNSIGDTLWTKNYDRNMDPSFIQQTIDSGFIITGANSLLKTNATGEIIWSTSIDFTETYFVEQTFDGGYIISGGTVAYTHLIKTDAYGHTGCNMNDTTTVVGTFNVSNINSDKYVWTGNATSSSTNTIVGHRGKATDLCSITNTSEIFNIKNEIVIYPNPFHNLCTFQISSEFENGELKIYNELGILMRKEKIIRESSFNFFRNELTNGIYFVQFLNDKGNIANAKLIIE